MVADELFKPINMAIENGYMNIKVVAKPFGKEEYKEIQFVNIVSKFEEGKTEDTKYIEIVYKE